MSKTDAQIGWEAWQHAVNAVGDHDATNAYAELVNYIRRELSHERLVELRSALRDIADGMRGKDMEINHEAADDLLLEYINDQGVTQYYGAIEKWYA